MVQSKCGRAFKGECAFPCPLPLLWLWTGWCAILSHKYEYSTAGMTEQQDKEQGRFLGLWWLQRAASSYLGQLLCEWERTPTSFKPLLFVMLCVCAPLSCFSYVQLFVMPWTVAHQAPLSLGFSRQEYWSGLPFPSPGALPDPGIKPASPSSPALAGRFFTTSATLLLGEAHWLKPPILARHHSNYLHELFYDRRSW